MITHIDVSSVLRRTVCELYSNLVTRPTGAAVRTEIEQQLAGTRGRSLTIIDFGSVGLLDYSCADEVVAKLLIRFTSPRASEDAYFVFRGIDDTHRETIESVLERHGLAAVMQLVDGHIRLLGELSDAERSAWDTVYRRGSTDDAGVAREMHVDATDAAVVLERLCARRLLAREGTDYVAVGGPQWPVAFQ